MVKALDDGDGRLGEKVAAVRDSNGLNSLHLAATRARLLVCRYLVEQLGLHVNASDINKGASPSSLLFLPIIMSVLVAFNLLGRRPALASYPGGKVFPRVL
jgi:hypothetical protein